MDLRALLFTADGSSSATLCRVMTDLGIEAEICSEMLVAVERISRQHYDAIVVDWELETESSFLLKTAREQKAQGLNLALVQDEVSVGRALQNGANSVIKKPVDPILAHDTLSTARDLILSRHSEQRSKDARIAAEQAESKIPSEPLSHESQTSKTGFLAQTMTHSAFEAEEKVGRPDEPSGELRWQAARGPASLHEEVADSKEVEPVSQKRWEEVKSIFRGGTEGESREAEAPTVNEQNADPTGVFSSLPEEPKLLAETEGPALPSYLIFAVVACLLVAAVLYVWAPGGSYLGRISSVFHVFSIKSSSKPAKHDPTPVAPQEKNDVAASVTVSPKPEPATPESEPIASTEVDPSKIQIIETKTIPKAGAQQPPSGELLLGSGQTPVRAAPPSDQAIAAAASHEPAKQDAIVTAPPPTPPVAPPVQEFHPRSEPDPETSPSPSQGRVGVIIPDSLRNSPAPSPASSLEPFAVPEATSLSLLVHRVEPEYPAQALSQRLEGAVVLQAWIAKDGSVRDLKLVRGYFALGRAAFDAVKQWRFKPFVQNGRPIDFQTSITLNFRYPPSN
jgi:periplasmic protein TonB